MTINLLAAIEAADPTAEWLLLDGRQPEIYLQHDCALRKQAPIQAHPGVKHFPYARVDRATIRRTKRLGPALSLSTTRQVYPDEDSAVIFA